MNILNLRSITSYMRRPNKSNIIFWFVFSQQKCAHFAIWMNVTNETNEISSISIWVTIIIKHQKLEISGSLCGLVCYFCPNTIETERPSMSPTLMLFHFLILYFMSSTQLILFIVDDSTYSRVKYINTGIEEILSFSNRGYMATRQFHWLLFVAVTAAVAVQYANIEVKKIQ